MSICSAQWRCQVDDIKYSTQGRKPVKSNKSKLKHGCCIMDYCYYLCQFVQTDFIDVFYPAVTSGAFCCDVVLDPHLDSWTPSQVNE